MPICNYPSSPSLNEVCNGGQYILFMTIIETYYRIHCELNVFKSKLIDQNKLFTHYDFIIVGAGSGGSVVASRLSEIPHWNILLIEAGNQEPLGVQIPSLFMNFLGTDIDWKYKTEPEMHACLNSPEQRCKWPRGKVLGGTSTINGMMYNRGNHEDYDQWEFLGNPGWGYDDVLPYFLKSEDNMQLSELNHKYHRSGGLLTVSRFPYYPPFSNVILNAAKELGYGVHDINGANTTGFMISQMNNKNGARISTARAFLEPVLHRPNLHILLNTTVTKIIINPVTKSASGVIIKDKNNENVNIYTYKEVIVSGGAINSPQILLLSGIGPIKDLHKVNILPIIDLPGVGKNLHNHVTYLVKFFINETDIPTLNWNNILTYLIHQNGIMSSTGLFSTTGKISTKYANPPNVPDLQFHFSGYLASCTNQNNNNLSRSINIFPVVLHPKSRGYITLASNNYLDHPKIFANYLSDTDHHDINVLIEGIKFAIKLSNTDALRAHKMELDRKPIPACENMIFGSDEYWECAVKFNTGPENHQVGSCKMGPSSDPMAVVDPELKVHGIKNLRIVDASIMPFITSGNINAVIIMIAEKASELIYNTWK